MDRALLPESPPIGCYPRVIIGEMYSGAGTALEQHFSEQKHTLVQQEINKKDTCKCSKPTMYCSMWLNHFEEVASAHALKRALEV